MRWTALLLALSSCADTKEGTAPVAIDSGAADPTADGGGAGAADAHGASHDDAGTCETIGRTGGTDTCLLFAYCGHRHLQIDCSARFTCLCSEPDVDAGPTKQVVYEPVFCESPATDMRPALEVAARACGW